MANQSSDKCATSRIQFAETADYVSDHSVRYGKGERIVERCTGTRETEQYLALLQGRATVNEEEVEDGFLSKPQDFQKCISILLVIANVFLRFRVAFVPHVPAISGY